MPLTYDVVIVGGGPAGISAALTCASQGLRCVLLGERRGGKLGDITRLTNWFGDTSADGKQLRATLYKQLDEQDAYITIKQASVISLQVAENKGGGKLFVVELQDGSRALGRTLIVATGTKQRQLGVPGEQALLGKGVSYCVTCDLPYFKSKTVALISEGDRAFAVAEELAGQAAQVYLFTSAAGKARAENVRVIAGARVEQIVGKGHVTGLVYRDNKFKQAVQLPFDGVFIELGAVGNSSVADHIVDIDADGFIKVDHATMGTSLAGVFAAGDVTNGRYKQVSIGIADGAKAALSAKQYVNSKEAT